MAAAENTNCSTLTCEELIEDVIKEKDSRVNPEEESSDPMIVGNLGDIVRKHDLWLSQLPRVKTFYAVKTNDEMPVLSLLAQLGVGFDCSNKSEIEKVLSLGVSPSRIIYAQTQKQISHLQYAAASDVRLTTFDSEYELDKINRYHPKAKLLLRFRPPKFTNSRIPIFDKFGCLLKSVPRLLKTAKQLGLDVIGVCFNVGRHCRDVGVYVSALEAAREIFNISDKFGFQFTLLDIGAGFIGNQNIQPDFTEICSTLRPAIDRYFPSSSGVSVMAEPGTFYVEASVTLITTVIGKRLIYRSESTDDILDWKPSVDINGGEKINDKTQDSRGEDDVESFMYYISDGIFGRIYIAIIDKDLIQLELWKKTNQPNCQQKAEKQFSSTVWGPTCHEWDCIKKNIFMPELNIGDILIIRNMGAYGSTMATLFNGTMKPNIHWTMSKEDRSLLEDIVARDKTRQSVNHQKEFDKH